MEEQETLTLEIHPQFSPKSDIETLILSKSPKFPSKNHQHFCTALSQISQNLNSQNLPLTPLSYFTATVSSLHTLSLDVNLTYFTADVIALLRILSVILSEISGNDLSKNREYVKEVIGGIVRSGEVSEEAVVVAIKCVESVVVCNGGGNWEEVKEMYGLIVGFVTDSRVKVRKQSHSCLHAVLRSFQRSASLAPASEVISTIFERYFLLLDEGLKHADPGCPKEAEEFIYVLDALRDGLHLMSINAVSRIMKYFELLLKWRQSFVTSRITDSLHVLCLSPTSEVDPKVLRDLLCTIAESVSQNENVDCMSFTARLLDIGTRKVYSLNRDVCMSRLHIVFHALGEILAGQHEEAAAIEAFRSLIFCCIDGGLIKQELEHVSDEEDGANGHSETTIRNLCATIESLLDHRYKAVWKISLKVVSAMFDKLGKFSYQLMRNAVKNLTNMQKMSDDTLQCRKELHECFGSVLGAIGPEFFLSLIPLNLEAQDPSEVNCWLFPILKEYTVGASLSFFRKSILSKLGAIRQKSQKLERDGLIFSSRSAEELVYSIWSLLPAFCNYPLDTASSFKDLKKELCNALCEEPNVCGVVCSSLQILIEQNTMLLSHDNDLHNDDMSIHVQRARAYYTPQIAADNLNTLKEFSRELLLKLLICFMRSSHDNGGCLQSTISQFVSISDKEVVTELFRKLVNPEEATKEDQPNSMDVENPTNETLQMPKRACLFDVAVLLLCGLDNKDVDMLFKKIKPALQEDEGLIQKKAYKLLSLILKDAHVFVTENLDDILQMMIKVLPSCHLSAKRRRINCLYFIIIHISKNESEQSRKDIVGSFLTEIILAGKEANKKTRIKAFDTLVQIGHAFGDQEQGGRRENLIKYFHMVTGGLAGETPQMISATVKAFACLAYEFTDLVSAAYNLLPIVLRLLKRKNHEIAKASLGLLKVLAAKSEAEKLKAHLKNMVEGLLDSQDDTRSHLTCKVKYLVEMLVRKCGIDAVKAVMPEEHMKLLTNIEKTQERKERRVTRHSELESKSVDTKAVSELGDEDSEDDEYMKTESSSQYNSKPSNLRSKHIHVFEELEDDPLDFLGKQKIRSVLQSDNRLKRKKAESNDDEVQVDSDGRLVINEGVLRPIKEKTTIDSSRSSKSLKKRRKKKGKSY
ncbi:hypothetical protein ACHQM5_018873 [Ranunculus cassubicifolius]